LLDIDLALIRTRLERLPEIAQVRLFDDIASDATFVTVLITLSESNDAALAALRKVLLKLPRMVPSVVDAQGNEIRSGSFDLAELRKHSVEL
jgi:hypothetical protein